MIIRYRRSGEGVCLYAMDNVKDSSAAKLLRRWHRPRWMRLSSGVILDDLGGSAPVRVHWRDVLDVRIQPQREVLR